MQLDLEYLVHRELVRHDCAVDVSLLLSRLLHSVLVVFRRRVTRKQFRFISLGFQVHKTAVIEQHAQALLFLELLDSFVL